MEEWKIVNGVNFNVTWVKSVKAKEFIDHVVKAEMLTEAQAKEAYDILVKK